MRRWPPAFRLLLVLVLGALAPGFGASAVAQDAAGKVLRIEYNSYPETLDPQRIFDISQDMVVGLGFEGLTRIDEELNTVPAAAESWDFSDDGLTLTFHLREKLTYSDGTPLTAERFRYAIERTCDPRTESINASFLFVVAGCEAFFSSLDETNETSGDDPPQNAEYQAAKANLGVSALDGRTLVIQLTEPAVYFPTMAAKSLFFPAKQELIESGGEAWWRDPAHLVGNGPFVIDDLGSDDGPSRMIFTANERYWGGRPALDRIEYVMANAARTGEERIAAYQRGELDMVWLAFEDFPAVEADPELQSDLRQLPRAATIHLAFNPNLAPFMDKKVREAFAYGFDREGYCQEINYGFCVPTLSWLPPDVPGAIATDAFAFNPDKARQALTESSYGGPDGLPEVVWYYDAEGLDGLGSRRGAEWLAAQYREVLGIELKLTPLAGDDWDRIWDDPISQLQWVDLGWFQDYPDPHNWFRSLWSCGAGYNRLGYCNPELDALIARADAELDPGTRIALYQEAGRLLVDDVPTIFLHHWAEAALVKPYVTGYAITPIDYWPGWTTPMTINVDRIE